MPENKKEIGEERGLIEQVRAGNLLAFSELVRRHEERAIRIAFSFVRNWEDARDIAQEAFVRAYENIGRFRSESRFSTWLYRILANQAKDFIRKQKTRRHLTLTNSDEDKESFFNNIAAVAPDSLQDLIHRELGEEIAQNLEKLPMQQKLSFRLRYLEGFSLEEIAELLGLTTGAVKAHLWQAGQKMKKSLESWLPEGGAL